MSFISVKGSSFDNFLGASYIIATANAKAVREYLIEEEFLAPWGER